MPERAEHREEAIMGTADAQHYAETHEKHAKLIYRAFLKDVRALGVSGRCLEVGAGPGVLAVMMVGQNPDVHITALDLSPDMKAVGEEYIKKKGLGDRIEYVLGDANDVGTIGGLGKFDLVYSTFSLHHWKDPAAAIGNLWNAVGEGGILYVHDLKRVWWSYLLPLGKGDRESIRAAYVPREIKRFLDDVGIKRYEIKTLFPYFWESMVARK